MGLFGRNLRQEEFEHEVLTELSYLKALYGDGAYRAAIEKADRPSIRRARRAVLTETARRLALEVAKPA